MCVCASVSVLGKLFMHDSVWASCHSFSVIQSFIKCPGLRLMIPLLRSYSTILAFISVGHKAPMHQTTDHIVVGIALGDLYCAGLCTP